jgi:hypothetical protein
VGQAAIDMTDDFGAEIEDVLRDAARFISSPASMKKRMASREKLFTFAKSFCGISIRGMAPEETMYAAEDNPIAANMGRPLVSKRRKTINMIAIGLICSILVVSLH